MNESTIFGVSARGVLAFIVTVSCCALAIWIKDIGVLKDLGFLVLGSYFSRQSNQSNGGSNVPSNSQVLQQPIQQDPGKQSVTGV